jgi:membrane fusion protein (multidrug efflux system)
MSNPEQKQKKSPKGINKVLKRFLIILILSVLAYFGWYYYQQTLQYEVTDNAYVGANVVQVSSRISGQINQISIENNKSVKKGELLFGLDDEPYQLTIHEQLAKLKQSTKNVGVDLSAVSVVRSKLEEKKALLENARLTAKRQDELFRKKFLSSQALDNAKTAVVSAEAEVRQAEAELVQTARKVEVVENQNPSVQESIATLEQARLNLRYSKVYSPVEGIVANLTARPGSFVQAGQPLFALIDAQSWWVDANFKETQLHGVVPGKLAKIRLDRCPDKEFNGVVDSIAGGTGASFSLLPPQNANSNWVKVTQRVPVRIRLTQKDLSCPFIIGTSAEVRVLLK